MILLCIGRAWSSSLSIVALDGSPGSSWPPFDSIGLAFDRVRARLLGGTVLSIELLEVCLRFRVLCEGESANSSPEASRDDGWTLTAVVILFRFAEAVDDGEDMFVE